jgi:hypothetical protein
MGSNSGSDIAWSVVFDQFRPRYGDIYDGFRYYGLSVRPVCGGRPQDAGSSEPVVLEHDYVDMGNGLGWATVNVGGSSDAVLGRTYLEDDLFEVGIYFDVDDPVSRLWGTPWRTPTKAEWDWLFDPDNVTWERDYNSTMMRYGWQVTSKITGKGFFFPVQSAGSFDSYWTITRHDVYPQNHWLAGFDYQNNTMSTEYFGGGGYFRAVVDLDQLPGYSPISVGDYDSWDHEDI